MEENYQLLIIKHLSEESTAEEESELEAWLKQDPLHQEEFTRFRELWQLTNKYEPKVDASTEMQWQSFKHHIGKGAEPTTEPTVNRLKRKDKNFLNNS